MSEEVRTTSNTGGEKGVKLERYDLIPVRPLEALARHYGVGANKYEDRNWEKGYEWSKSYAALQRHLNAFWRGEDVDEETGSSHLAAAAFHVFALMEYIHTHPEFDDRVKSPKVVSTGWFTVGGEEYADDHNPYFQTREQMEAAVANIMRIPDLPPREEPKADPTPWEIP